MSGDEMRLLDGVGVALPGVFGRVGLELPKDLPFEEWERIGSCLLAITGRVRWWLGDWLVFGERRYGDAYAQAIDMTGLAYQTLANVMSVSGRVESSRRKENLSWSHHEVVAKLSADEQSEWLEKVEVESWTVKELREAIRLAKEGPAELDSPVVIRLARDSLRNWYERYADRVSPPERVRLMNEIVIEVERDVSKGTRKS